MYVEYNKQTINWGKWPQGSWLEKQPDCLSVSCGLGYLVGSCQIGVVATATVCFADTLVFRGTAPVTCRTHVSSNRLDHVPVNTRWVIWRPLGSLSKLWLDLGAGVPYAVMAVAADLE
jgi:hypothetical protein